MKKMNNKGFSLVELIVVVAIMAVLMAVLVPTLIRNVEKTRVQKDKSAIAEIHHAIELAIADEEYKDAQSAGLKTFTDGTIEVKDLFTNKEDSDDGTQLAEEVALTVGETVKLTSKMKNHCTLEIRVMDYTTGKVILDVTSNKAAGADLAFHIDSTGENTGTWVSTTAAP
jgi:type IV pilus assembly protein PilA